MNKKVSEMENMEKLQSGKIINGGGYTHDDAPIIQSEPIRQPEPTRQPEPSITDFINPKPQVDNDLLREAMELAKAGKSKELKAFISKHKGEFDINGVDKQGRNLAHYAAMSGDVKTLHTVQKSGVDMTATDNNGNTIAHTACHGNGSILGSDAPEVGFIKTIERYGVDVTEPNNDGETPLDIIAPVNKDGKRQVPGVVQHGMYGEGIDKNGNRCPVTFYGPNEPAEATAEYLAGKQGDERPIESDTRTSLERNTVDLINGRMSNLDNFNNDAFDLLNRANGTLRNKLKESQTANSSLDESNVVDSAFNLIQRGNNSER